MVNLDKGGKISLAKAAEQAGIQGALTKLRVGLGWDTNKYDGGHDFDLDVSAFLTGASGKVEKEQNFIFYNNLKTAGVEHTGDNLTGDSEGDDEVILINLPEVEADVQKISFSVTIHKAVERQQNFGMVSNSYIRVVDDVSNIELLRYDLGEDYSIETALVVGELYRHNGEWKFNAIGAGFENGLAALCKNFGLNV